MTNPAPSTEQNQQPESPPKWFTEWVEANKSAPQTPPASPPASAPSNSRGYGADILDALNALPEKLVNAIQESAPQKPPSTEQPVKQEEKKDENNTPPVEPGKKSFAERWFG